MFKKTIIFLISFLAIFTLSFAKTVEISLLDRLSLAVYCSFANCEKVNTSTTIIKKEYKGDKIIVVKKDNIKPSSNLNTDVKDNKPSTITKNIVTEKVIEKVNFPKGKREAALEYQTKYIDRTKTIIEKRTIERTPNIYNTYPKEIINNNIIKKVTEEYDDSSLQRKINNNRSLIKGLTKMNTYDDDLTDNSISDLGDVDTTGLINGNILSWDGTNWIPSSTSNLETTSTLVNNGDNTFTYTNEDGTVTTIDIKAEETTTTIAAGADGHSIDYTDEDGLTTNIDIKGLETTTSISLAGSVITYTDEDGTTTTMDIKDAETTTVLANTVVGHKIGDYTDEEGATKNINETITSIALNTDSLDYVAEDGATTNVDFSKYVDNTELSNWTGSTNLTTLGTITTGTWNGTAIDISDYTNLSGDAEVILTGDSLSLASSIARDTELHNALTLAGVRDYLTLNNQELTLNQIDISDDTNLAVGTGLALTDDTLSLNSGIDNLTDVDTSTNAPTDNQVLSWDNANSKWIPTSLNDDDVTNELITEFKLSGNKIQITEQELQEV